MKKLNKEEILMYREALQNEYPTEKIVFIGSHDVYPASTEQFAKYVLDREGTWVPWSTDPYDPELYLIEDISDEELNNIKYIIETAFINGDFNSEEIQSIGILECVHKVPGIVILGLNEDWGVYVDDDMNVYKL